MALRLVGPVVIEHRGGAIRHHPHLPRLDLRVRGFDPQLVVDVDAHPVTDGLELCRRIRARTAEPYTYFIMLTGRTGKESFLEAMDAGVDDFMTKPVDAEELQARIQAAARILGLRQEMHFLEGLLPICSYCRRIRNETAGWVSLQRYVEDHAKVKFSHGVCPECYARHLGPQIMELEST